MSADYLALLKAKNVDSRRGRTAKTDETTESISSGSFGSAPRAQNGKRALVEPLPVSAEWFAAQGCHDVLRADLDHISRYLPIDTVTRNRVLVGYVAVWLSASRAELAPHRKDNAGRRAANNAIRDWRDSLFSKFKGC